LRRTLLLKDDGTLRWTFPSFHIKNHPAVLMN